jgi:pantoate--beta-alanine ligase
MQRLSKIIKLKGKTLGFVPTMGALHEGHLSLIRRARKETGFVVVSIFVNPIQFGQNEDLKKYPRNLKQDALLCRKEGADIIFYPDARDMYPKNFRTYVGVDGLSEVLCGRFRPGHFKGVTTVVAKLFNIVSPDIAYFGQKDAQQAIIIKKMVKDLDMPVTIKIMPTVRQKDGLALSSRNTYLNQNERKEAIVLYQALNLARSLIREGRSDTADIIRRMKRLINKKKTSRIQYASIVDLENLRPVDRIKGGVLIALAVWIGKTRLIDNIIINN